jgi:hypothetical protein
MADFVAVIRRAVDGLATNTPETRARVYDKARGAVQRQLENMKPRPPEEMLLRQMEKLEAAIASVETEHSEALPADTQETDYAPQTYEADQPPVAEEETPAGYAEAPVADVPVPASEPVVVDDDRDAQSYSAPYQGEEPVADEVAAGESREEDDWRAAPAADMGRPAEQHWQDATSEDVAPQDTVSRDVAPEDTASHEMAPDTGADTAERNWYEEQAPEQAEEAAEAHSVSAPETPAERYGDWRDDVPDDRDTAAARAIEGVQHEERPPFDETPSLVEEPEYPHAPSSADPYHQTEGVLPEPPHHGEQDASPVHWPPGQHHGDETEPAAAQAAASEPWTFPDPSPDTARPSAEGQAAAAWDHVDDLTRHLDSGSNSRPVEAHFDQEMRASAEPVRMPQVSDIPQAGQPAEGGAAQDPFEEYVNAQPSAAPPAQQDGRDPWSDLEDLIGYTKEAPASEQKPQAASSEEEFDDLLAAPAKPYRVTPVRKRNYAGIVLGLIGLLLVGGGAYAVWLNRDSLNDMVGGLIQSSTGGSETAEQTAPDSAPAGDPAPAPQTPPAQPQQDTAAPAQQTPPPADGSSSTGKFTQRLLQDGSEVDAGPGEAGSLAQNAEGQSVAQLNAPPANPGPGAPPSEDGAEAGAAQNEPATPSATPSETAAVAGEKMFLYEERIGQTAPTAIEGSVSWSLQREPAQNGGPPEPVVQGRITVPGRGLTALMTLKRNTDSSLPASHLIEIVFAVPPDFEGGAIDSVLRIAMKQTEQDRGNALVAVPAKITDDFHMIALNDFPDARSTNLDLLRTRNWIDIPLAYRNGRRALLTLQKGPDGQKAFDDAIREWSQSGGTQNGQ